MAVAAETVAAAAADVEAVAEAAEGGDQTVGALAVRAAKDVKCDLSGLIQ